MKRGFVVAAAIAVVVAVSLYRILSRPGPETPRRATATPAPRLAEPTVAPSPRSAVVDLQPVGGSGVFGRLTLTEVVEGSGVRIKAQVKGLRPGRYALRVHELGDCSAPDGSSAGPPFDPRGDTAGGAEAPPALGHLEVGPTGYCRETLVADQARLTGGADGILARSILIHPGDDEHGQVPGQPLACGVIAAR